ncbi:hypothetical protein ACGFZP_21260 [Kitasatospora sp. NPDC048239]|uniref:protein kinase domain-containing protein n=1 Tax=Kitasatospora sp. NPDC048239 TaxID=3364046 RepID=UPI0037211854
MADGIPAEPGPVDGDQGPRPGPRTRVDWRLRGRRERGPQDAVPPPSSRLGAAALPRPRTRVDPDAPTRVKPQHPPQTVTRGPAPGRGGHFGGAFPAALLDRYEPYGVAGSGTEGTVWHVRRTDGGGEAAVKVAAPGQGMDAELLEHLRNDDYRRHVPQILGHGRIEHAGAGCDWVAMEYLPTTLADHIADLRREGRHTEEQRIARIVGELVALLDFWQQRIRRTPVDFKPANILVRPDGGPGEFVIADFGGVARLSRNFSTEMQVTIPYMAPEQLAGTNHPAGPWWALGNVLYELFTGRPRYLGADGLLVSDEVLQYDLVMGEEVDLRAVTDPRQLLLLQGLFTRNPAQRWTAGQVRAWLGGGSPEVARPAGGYAGGGYAGAPAHRPITFLGDPYHDPSVLARAMLGRSADAAHWLAGGGGAVRLLAWLRDEVQDTVFDLHYLRDVDLTRGAKRAGAASLAVLALGAAFAPGATPYYGDRPVDAAGIVRITSAPDALAFIDELVAASAPAIAARYDCDHPECSGEHCGRLLALAQLPEVLAEVERAAQALGGGRRTGRGSAAGRGSEGVGGALSADEQADAHRRAVRLAVDPREHAPLVAELSPLPAALHRLPVPAAVSAYLPARLSATVAAVAAAVVEAALAVRAAVRRTDPDTVRRRWSALRRRAVRCTPDSAAGRAALVAAAVLRTRAVRAADPADPGGGEAPAWRPWAHAWWVNARTGLPRRAAAALLMLIALSLMLWSGAVWRLAIDAGTKLEILPNGDFGGPLRTAGERAAHQVVWQLGAALAAALTAALFPARVGRGTLALTAAAAFAIGYLRLGPPMTVLRPPQALADRVVVFEGGMGSWAGVAATLAVVLALVLVERSATNLLKPAHDARERTVRTWGRLATRRRPPVAGRTGPARDARQWRPGPRGLRDRALFALGATLVLVVLLWGAVEVRLAATGHHPTAASWGTGRTGAAYQAGFVVLLATVSVLSALATPRTARRLFVAWLPATLLLGAWPPPLGPLEAVRIPVAGPWFESVAELWGHSAFWAALLVALPVAAYGILRTLRRTRR